MHAFGPQSIEKEDTYIRLDQDIASLLCELDKQVGKGNYSLFLTADHAATDVPQYLKNNKIPAGYYDSDSIVSSLNRYLASRYNVKDLIENMSNGQLFFDKEKIKAMQLNLNTVLEESKQKLLKEEDVFQVLMRTNFEKFDYNKI